VLKERDAEEFGADSLLAHSLYGRGGGGGIPGQIDYENGMESPAESVGEMSGGGHSSVAAGGMDSARRGIGDEEEEDEDLERSSRFERLLNGQMDMPTFGGTNGGNITLAFPNSHCFSSDNGLYLARTVAPVLTKALAEVFICSYPNLNPPSSS
jgi:hypothetical protein